jgi:hypothetical protein
VTNPLASMRRTGRFCRRGHQLILGETAYAAVAWRAPFLYGSGDRFWFFACDASGCRYGGPEEHARLENEAGNRGTRRVGTMKGSGAPLWQHRVMELRCRACNRERVARSRANRKQGQ